MKVEPHLMLYFLRDYNIIVEYGIPNATGVFKQFLHTIIKFAYQELG